VGRNQAIDAVRRNPVAAALLMDAFPELASAVKRPAYAVGPYCEVIARRQ
jgi:hypothetical protein